MDFIEYIKLMLWTSGVIAAPLLATQAVAKEKFNRYVGKQLALFNPEDWIKKLPQLIISIFNEIFGERHLSMKCITRSSIVSFTLFIFIFCIFSLSASDFSILKFIISAGSSINDFESTLALITLITFNIIPDYFSLLQTRFMIKLIDTNTTVLKTFTLLLIDIIATAGIFYIYFVFYLIITGFIPPTAHSINLFLTVDFYMYLIDQLHSIPSNSNNSNFSRLNIVLFTYWTTFATSIWVWLFSFLSIILISVQKLGGPLWTMLVKTVLNVEKKPFQSLAWIGVAFVDFLFIICAPFVILF